MDPYLTVLLAFEHFDTGHLSASREYIEHYTEWRRNRGFKPPTQDHPYFRKLASKVLGADIHDADQAIRALQQMADVTRPGGE